VSTTSSLSHKCGESVSVSDDRGLFDSSTHIVVGEAQLVGERFEHVRRCPDGVVDNCVPSRRGHTLSGCNRNQVELVGILVGDGRVYNGSWQWVLESTDVACEESGVHPLTGVHVEQLRRVTKAKSREGLLDLVDLSSAHSFDLSLTNTISVEDDLCWVGTIGSLEGLASVGHSIAESISGFLTDVVLDYAGRPVGCGAIVHGAAQC